MRRSVSILLVFAAAVIFSGLLGGKCFGQQAFLPPIESKGLMDAELNPIPQEQVESYLEHVGTTHTFRVFEGQNQALMEQEVAPGRLVLSAGFPVDMGSDELFDTGFQDGAYTIHLAAIASVDAVALRLEVDLSGLRDGEEVWVIDPTVPRAFGPFTNEGSSSGGVGRWLPTTEGGLAVLMVRTQGVRQTQGAEVPQIRLVGVSHFFREIPPLKALPCNIDLACEASSSVRDLGAGVGYLILPYGLFGMGLCTATLINNPDTPELEPYLLTSNHCITDVTDPTQIEVIWDYRSATCNGNDAPALSSLPRSAGDRILKTDATLDISLLRLDTVPNGTYGRTWLMWDNRQLQVGDQVVVIHHPNELPLRISYGTIQAVDQTEGTNRHLARVHYDNGVTEEGSSGSALLLVSAGYEIVGTLSSGTTHSCTNNRNNLDWFSSFRQFLPEVQDYLSGTTPPSDNQASTCPAGVAFKDNPAVLKQLRAFRDQVLAQSEEGRAILGAYYLAAPCLARLVEESPAARAVFIGLATPFAALGERLIRAN